METPKPSSQTDPEHEQLSLLGSEVHEKDTPYEVIRGYTRPKGNELAEIRELTTEQVKEWYVTLTDELIRRMEGRDGDKPDYVIFLDKSARPVSWLVKEFWPLLAREPGTDFDDGVVPEMPKFKFLNIDREQWQGLMGDYETEGVDSTRVPAEMIDDLRAIFTTRLLDEDTPAKGEETLFDGKNVLIVDEVSVTGATSAVASSLVSRAFPDANVSTHHWMVPRKIGTQSKFNSDLPVWYDRDSNLGRGIGDRDTAISARSENRTQRRGKYFLSIAHRVESTDDSDRKYKKLSEVDPQSLQLRAEAKQLAKDFKDGKILYFPSPSRTELDSASQKGDDHEQRAVSVNSGMTYQEVNQKRFKPYA